MIAAATGIGAIGQVAVAGLVGGGGAVLVIYAVVWSRLKSFGPKGIELFEELREKTAAAVEAAASDEMTVSDEAAAEVTTANAQAAATIRAARTLDELAEAISGAVKANAELEARTVDLEREVRLVKERARRPRSTLNRIGYD